MASTVLGLYGDGSDDDGTASGGGSGGSGGGGGGGGGALGTKFLCSEVIALIRSEVDDICLQIINFEDLSSQPPPPATIPPPSQANNRLVTRYSKGRLAKVLDII
ncbi:hypothetical protein M0802_010775 [Mischocyttarus mexicanus]|nr:hypothetical protein M0802_010775 [Mischocyttarus mexicanus]